MERESNVLHRPSTASAKSARHITKRLAPPVGEDPVHDRQCRVPGFSQRRLNRAGVVLVGAGGLGGEVGQGLVRKGVGALTILDYDFVEPSNLNRQRFFARDLRRRKAIALADNLAAEATDNSLIIGHALSFEEAVERGVDLEGDVVVCGVDNNATRLAVSRRFLGGRPLVFLGVDELADHGYVFVQERGGPCFACLYPHALEEHGGQCPKVGATYDILKVLAGIALYAVDFLLMARARSWNFREVSLAGFAPDVRRMVEARDGCPVCSRFRETAR